MMFGEKKTGEVDYVQVGKNILREDDLQIPIMYKGDSFVLRYPNPALQAEIEVEVARRLQGFPLESYTNAHILSVRAYCTVDVLYVREKCPDWFKGPWSCIDEDLVGTLYQGYLGFRNKFLESIKQDKYAGNR